MDEYERFIFDTQGCILLEDVLSGSEIDRLRSDEKYTLCWRSAIVGTVDETG
jgi:hypothetical protein